MSGLFATYGSVSRNQLIIISHSPRMISRLFLSQLSDIVRLILGVSAVVFALGELRAQNCGASLRSTHTTYPSNSARIRQYYYLAFNREQFPTRAMFGAN